MKFSHLLYIGVLASATVISCQKENKQDAHKSEPKTEEKSQNNKRKPLDFSPVKAELKLDKEKEAQFDEITAKYQKLREETYGASKKGEKVDRLTLFTKFEELTKLQVEEMSKVLTPEQMPVFNKFVDENTRKRPRYNNELLAKIEKEAGLSADQMKTLNAANDAFEKAFMDAHDVYHGNNELAKEYWDKFDTQRKAVIQKTLTPEQYKKFEEVVKEVKFTPRKKS